MIYHDGTDFRTVSLKKWSLRQLHCLACHQSGAPLRMILHVSCEFFLLISIISRVSTLCMVLFKGETKVKQATAMHPQHPQHPQHPCRAARKTCCSCGAFRWPPPAVALLTTSCSQRPFGHQLLGVPFSSLVICPSSAPLGIFCKSSLNGSTFGQVEKSQGCWMVASYCQLSQSSSPGYAQLEKCCTQGTTSPNYFVTVWVSHWIQIMRLLHRNRNIWNIWNTFSKPLCGTWRFPTDFVWIPKFFFSLAAFPMFFPMFFPCFFPSFSSEFFPKIPQRRQRMRWPSCLMASHHGSSWKSSRHVLGGSKRPFVAPTFAAKDPWCKKLKEICLKFIIL